MAHQRCKLCGRADGFDFTVTGDVWSRVAGPFEHNVLCLKCFDYLASVKGFDYSTALADEVHFAGEAGSFTLRVVSRSKATGCY